MRAGGNPQANQPSGPHNGTENQPDAPATLTAEPVNNRWQDTQIRAPTTVLRKLSPIRIGCNWRRKERPNEKSRLTLLPLVTEVLAMRCWPHRHSLLASADSADRHGYIHILHYRDYSFGRSPKAATRGRRGLG